MVLQNLPVRFAIDRAGLVGADGATHAGSFDINYLACLPNIAVMAPADEGELVHAVATAAAHDSGPIAFRYPRGNGNGVALPATGEVWEIGRGRIVRARKPAAEQSGVAILSLGTRLDEALKAADLLAARGLPVSVADARFAKPLDTALIDQLAREHSVVITVEEGAAGGFGAAVMHHLAHAGLLDHVKVRPLTLPDSFIDHNTPAAQLAAAGLTARDIAHAALSALGIDADAASAGADRALSTPVS